MLHESQEEIKELRSKCGPAAHLCFSQSYGLFTGVRDKSCRVLKERKEKLACRLQGVLWLTMPSASRKERTCFVLFPGHSS